MASYVHGAVSVGSSAVQVCTVAAESDGVLVQNSGSAAVFLGNSAVTATGAKQGIQLAANATITIPSIGDAPHDLWAISATSSTVNFLFPAV